MKTNDKSFIDGPSALKHYRERAGLTQSELAEKVSTDRSNITNMESGRRLLGRDMAQRLAKVLKVDDYRKLM